MIQCLVEMSLKDHRGHIIMRAFSVCQLGVGMVVQKGKFLSFTKGIVQVPGLQGLSLDPFLFASLSPPLLSWF